jgi:hypothetical protein
MIFFITAGLVQISGLEPTPESGVSFAFIHWMREKRGYEMPDRGIS